MLCVFVRFELELAVLTVPVWFAFVLCLLTHHYFSTSNVLLLHGARRECCFEIGPVGGGVVGKSTPTRLFVGRWEVLGDRQCPL